MGAVSADNRPDLHACSDPLPGADPFSLLAFHV